MIAVLRDAAAGRVSDKAQCNSDAHGCIACAHTVVGPAIQGSPDVIINSLPALRVGDPGLHAVCCGTNMWQAAKGAQTVVINGKAAYRKGTRVSTVAVWEADWGVGM